MSSPSKFADAPKRGSAGVPHAGGHGHRPARETGSVGSPTAIDSASPSQTVVIARPDETPAEPEPPSRPSRLGVLRHRHFRNVWGAAFISSVGGWMEMVGIQMIVAKATGSLTMLGYFAAAHLLPILALGIFGGLVADRVNRRKLLVVTQAILMLIAAAVAVAAYYADQLPAVRWLGDLNGASGLVAALFLLSIAQGVVMAFNIPAWQVLTPRLVPRNELTKAITLNGIQFNAARVVGPAIAGVILGMAGATPLFVFNTLTFLAVLIAVSRTPDAPAPPRDGQRAWPQIRDAAAFIFGQKGPFCVFLAMVVMSLFAAPLIRMLPLYVIDVYRAPVDTGAADLVTSLLIAVLGVGAVLGGLALKYFPAWYPKHHFIPVAIAGAGLTILLFGLTRHLTVGYVAMFFVGLFWIWGFNPAWAAMQGLVSDQMRGRVMAMANVAAFGVTAIGNIAAGWLGEGVEALLASGRVVTMEPGVAKEIGTHFAVAGPAAGLLIAGIIMLIWRVPEVDGLKPGHPEYTHRRNIWDGLTARAHRPRPAAAASPEPARNTPAWEPETDHAGAK